MANLRLGRHRRREVTLYLLTLYLLALYLLAHLRLGRHRRREVEVKLRIVAPGGIQVTPPRRGPAPLPLQLLMADICDFIKRDLSAAVT